MARSSDGVEIAYSVHGGGRADEPVVVLVHGWTADRTYWDEQVVVLAERHRVVALDLGGHGASGIRRTDWSMEAFGEDVVAVVDEVTTGKVVLVGHAMGGDAVVHAAVQLGDRVVGLVWVDTYRTLGDPASSPEEVEAFLAPYRDDFAGTTERFARGLFSASAAPALVDRVVADMVSAPREIALGSLLYAPTRQPLILAALRLIAAPVVAINPGTGPTDVAAMARFGVEAIVLDGTGHFAMLEDPVRFNEALVPLLARFCG